MVDRINGGPKPGVWFSADVRFLTVVVNGMTAQSDLGKVNTSLEFVLETLSTRGTIIALAVDSEFSINVMVDYAQAYDDPSVIAELEALINSFPGLSSASIIGDPLIW